MMPLPGPSIHKPSHHVSCIIHREPLFKEMVELDTAVHIRETKAEGSQDRAQSGVPGKHTYVKSTSQQTKKNLIHQTTGERGHSGTQWNNVRKAGKTAVRKTNGSSKQLEQRGLSQVAIATAEG